LDILDGLGEQRNTLPQQQSEMNYNPNDMSAIKPLSAAGTEFDPVFNAEDMQQMSYAAP
jgi:hypothetical protein